MAALDSVAELNGILEEWNRDGQNGVDPLQLMPQILTRMAELIERETEAYFKMDPDPFDDRHPGRANPTCALGHMMKALFKMEAFMNKLVSVYMMSSRDQVTLHTAACRLLLDILPGLDTTIVFQETDGIVRRLFQWAETAEDPLRSYATGLLAGAMELQDVASDFKEKNSILVPLMLHRLHSLKNKMLNDIVNQETSYEDDKKRHFSIFSSTPRKEELKKHAANPEMGEKQLDKSDTNNTKSLVANVDLGTYVKNATDTDDTKSLVANVDLGTYVKDALNSEKQILHVRDTNSKAIHGDHDSPNAVTDGHKISQVDQHVSDVTVADQGIYSPEKITKPSSVVSWENIKPDDVSPMEKECRRVAERQKKIKRALSPSYYSEDLYQLKKSKKYGESGSFDWTDRSNSSWAEMEPYVIGSHCMSPLSDSMKQRLILQYLTPMGEYQELITAAFEHNALDLIFFYVNLKENRDVRLGFEALKYLATLLCHKKFAIEFLQLNGVQKLLEVYRPSIAATGVSLCLYYLSYFEDAMERVCLLPEHVLSSLVSYTLWLLECSHDSSRCHAAMFFSQAFQFRVILELFDMKDGLRRLFNVISTLEILNTERDRNLTEDQIFTMRQSARHVCVALKKYFEAHLAVKADQLRRSHTRTEGGSPFQETPSYKATKLTTEVVQENLELLMELMPIRAHWMPETTFHKLGGISLLTQLVAMAPEWNNYPGKPETIKSALDVITVCTVTPKSQLALLENVSLPDNVFTPAISVMIGLAEGEVLADPEVQKSVLNIIINCVDGPIERLGGGVGRYMNSTGSKKRINWKMGEDILSKMWNGVRTNNGIMVLLKLLSLKTPITDADALRVLACKALVGLSRSETVRQIISKLPIFINGQLQALMKEPVLQDKRQEHVKFCKFASQLLERVSGKHAHSNFDASLEEIRRADIVAQTKIIFQERELLQLIHCHLMQKGLMDSASLLQREANLPRCSTPPITHPASPHLFSSPLSGTPRLSRQISQPIGSYSSSIIHGIQMKESPMSTPGTPGPIKFSLVRPNNHSPPNGIQNKNPASKCRFLRDKDQGGFSSPLSRYKNTLNKNPLDHDMSLDKIVTEYLRKQHALCRNPVSTCPPMSLFMPHRCPEPRGRNSAPSCITSRLYSRSTSNRREGMDWARANRKYIYSRFRPIRTYRDGEDDGFSCCAFSACEQYLILGTYSGDLKLTNLQTGEEAGSFNCFMAPINHMEPSRDSKLLLTGCTSWGGMPGSALWTFGSNIENKYSFDDFYVEFSKLIQDRVIGNRDETAHIYDVGTGQHLMTLFDADKANNYRDNRATFNPTDDLVLNDGVLWDVRSGKTVHKFDKFNSFVSGVFHPLGLEIIINSEVWDVRTFRLLHTVPALDQCQIRFNHSRDVIYAIHIDEEFSVNDERRSPYGSTFRTFDATDYSSIATVDVKPGCSISDLCTDKADWYLAVVENQQYQDTGAEEFVCRLYEIGKLKDEDDDQADDDEEEEEEEEVIDEDEEDDELLNLDNTSLDGGSDEDNDDDEDEDGENDDNDDNDGSWVDDDDDVEFDDDDDVELDDILYELV